MRVERRALPAEWPAGPFDLVVCSELLYYWDEPTLEEALAAMADSLAPGGRLVAVHYRPQSSVDPSSGDEVHALLRERLALAHVGGRGQRRASASTSSTHDERAADRDRRGRPRRAGPARSYREAGGEAAVDVVCAEPHLPYGARR